MVRGRIDPRWMMVLPMLSACGGPLSEGRAEFDQGHYAAAKQALALGEQAEAGASPDRRASYALYRGMTLGALGDVARASVWLRQARDLEAAHPGCLAGDDGRRLRAALSTYEIAP